MAVAQCGRGRADRRRGQRRCRSRRLRTGRKAARTDLRDRKPARRRRHHRRQHGRQGRARRPYRPGLWLDCSRERALFEAALRHGQRFCAGGAVRSDTAGRCHHGRWALQDARRARRARRRPSPVRSISRPSGSGRPRTLAPSGLRWAQASPRSISRSRVANGCTEIIAGRIDFAVSPVTSAIGADPGRQARGARDHRHEARRVAPRRADDHRGGTARPIRSIRSTPATICRRRHRRPSSRKLHGEIVKACWRCRG